MSFFHYYLVIRNIFCLGNYFSERNKFLKRHIEINWVRKIVRINWIRLQYFLPQMISSIWYNIAIPWKEKLINKQVTITIKYRIIKKNGRESWKTILWYMVLQFLKLHWIYKLLSNIWSGKLVRSFCYLFLFTVDTLMELFFQPKNSCQNKRYILFSNLKFF